MEAAIDIVLKKLRLQFIFSVTVLLYLGLLSYFLPQQTFLFSQELSLPFQSFSILLFLIGVPFSLRWFHHKTRAIRAEKPIKERLPAYQKAASTRMYAFSIIAVFALFLRVFTTMPNALVFFLMTMLFFLFCIPVKGQLIKELELFPEEGQKQEGQNKDVKEQDPKKPQSDNEADLNQRD